MLFVVKIFVSALIIALASEGAKRSNFWASILVSLPLVSLLTLSWVYFERRDLQQIERRSTGILWAVITSLAFFLILSLAIRYGFGYPISLFISCVGTLGAYASWIWILGKFSIQI